MNHPDDHAVVTALERWKAALAHDDRKALPALTDEAIRHLEAFRARL